MKQVPLDIKARFDALLAKRDIPEKSRFHYRKCLRYFLDFCHKYELKPSDRKSLPQFLRKLRDKRQNDHQRKQASHAISIYYELCPIGSAIKKTSERKTEIEETRKQPKSLHANWKPVYSALDSEIKIRHYSPKTLKAYKGWVRQFQDFTKSKDPGLLAGVHPEIQIWH